jgi:mycofactocin system glycosyltransferase
VSSRPPLPVGFTVTFDVGTRFGQDDGVLYGGSPWRLLRLTRRGAGLVRSLRRGAAVDDPAIGALARRLVDAGLAHPHPPVAVSTPALEVVVPAYDRPEALASCLDALAGLPVVVVDDASRDPDALARVVGARSQVRLVRREVNAGPASARNTGVEATTAPAVAFVDSDCLVTPEQLRRLCRHLADPCVGAVAPRITAQPMPAASAALRGFAGVGSPLDMGCEPVNVRPGGVVGYVPSTVMIVRRAAFEAVAGFDAGLRVGEDVDFVWRLADAGWSVRYDPTTRAAHAEPASWPSWLRRRFRYGTSAGALGVRHGSRLAGPALGGLLAPVAVAGLARRSELRATPMVQAAGRGVGRTVTGLGRWGLQLWGPALVVATPGGRKRLAMLTLLAVPPTVRWSRRRPPVGVLRFVAASLADDTAYAAGVWTGCLRAATWVPLLPKLRAPAADT